MTEAQQQQAHVQPPPENSPLVKQVAQILAAGYAVHITVEALAALLKPWRVMPVAIAAALMLVDRGTQHTPRRMLGPNRRDAADADLYYRAAYVLNASQRITKQLLDGVPAKQAILRERRFYQAHELARRNRLESANKIDVLREQFGPLLGWYLNPLLNNDPECVAANGHNFNAMQMPVIGWPGAVHPNCGCVAGPPHPGAGSVDEATKWLVYRKRKTNPKYKVVPASRSRRAG